MFLFNQRIHGVLLIIITALFLLISCSKEGTASSSEGSVNPDETSDSREEVSAESPSPDSVTYHKTNTDGRIDVVFINPGVSTADHATGGFWYNVSSFMQAAANDLDIHLEILYAERDHLQLHRLVEEIAERNHHPDYLVIVNEMKRGGIQLEKAVQAQIPTMMILNTLSSETDRLKYGAPREKHPLWIGSLVPDNYLAGNAIADNLFEEIKKRNASKVLQKIEVIGLAGDFVTPASVDRNEGLQEAVNADPRIHLNQTTVCNWSRDEARQKVEPFMKRYPNTDVIWAANDPIALGAIDALEAGGYEPGSDVLVGGLNWDLPALKKIREGKLTLSMGGHFMVGGWAMVLLYDYYHGIDFGEETPNLRMKIFDKIDEENVNQYLDIFENRNWEKIDFKKFSRIHNSALDEYPFSLKAILEQF